MTDELDELYNTKILTFAGNISHAGRLVDADASATMVSRLCGSQVTVDLKSCGDVVTDFAHEVKACALGQCASSIMASHVVGASALELRALQRTMRCMLKENGPAPTGKWADLAILKPVQAYKGRHASVLLTFDAVVKALDDIAATSSV